MNAPLSILYIEDDADIRMIASLAFGIDPAISTRCAASAHEALAILERWCPDAIVLDVMMPDVDGVALARQIRAFSGLADVPIVFMTARARPSDIADYHATGAKGVIVKPFDPMSLAAELRMIVARVD